MQHRPGCLIGKCRAHMCGEFFERAALSPDQQTRVRTELADAEVHGIAQSVGDGFGALRECAWKTTGFPAASAEAVSPPATEKASGKLLAPQTATGPMGIRMRRTSGLGSGLRSGIARSMRASRQEPSRTSSANIRNWLTVRP